MPRQGVLGHANAKSCNVALVRLQREEEVAYASSQGPSSQPGPQPQAQATPPHAALTPFSKFEEKKTNEKMRKVTTVKKFFSPSTRIAPKKGTAPQTSTLIGGRKKTNHQYGNG